MVMMKQLKKLVYHNGLLIKFILKGNNMTKENKPLTVIESLNVDFSKRKTEFISALPKNISYEKFERVAKTAIIQNNDLLNADRPSLFLSCLKSAQDGLLPDGRESALVIYNTKVKTQNNQEVWIKKVQYMPMVGGILKKIRNSGELLSITAHVVYQDDEFSFCLGDDENIKHIPNLDANPEKIKCVYAIVKTKDGGIYREIMTVNQINAIRNQSKAYTPNKTCIWSQHWEEMAKKTVIRRLSKRLPMSTDLVEIVSRDDNLHSLNEIHIDKPASLFDKFKETEPLSLTNNEANFEIPADIIAKAEKLNLDVIKKEEVTNGA
jgi:recombination protein RecT